jgi:hypothetical protein
LDKQIDVEHLAALKSYLEKRLVALESKVELYKEYIRAVDSVLTRSSFKVAAELLKETPVTAGGKPIEREAAKETAGAQKTDLVSRADGGKLGMMAISKNSVTVTPAENMSIPVDSGTFNTFFIRKILNNMVEKDEEQVKLGKLSDKDKMKYLIEKNSDGTLKELVILNYRDEGRLKEVTTTIRWTLEKVAQKPVVTK